MYTAKNAMTTNQREYSDAEATARLLFKVGECRLLTECVFQVVHYGLGGCSAQGEGADRVDESARGS